MSYHRSGRKRSPVACLKFHLSFSPFGPFAIGSERQRPIGTRNVDLMYAHFLFDLVELCACTLRRDSILLFHLGLSVSICTLPSSSLLTYTKCLVTDKPCCPRPQTAMIRCCLWMLKVCSCCYTMVSLAIAAVKRPKREGVPVSGGLLLFF